MTLNHRIQRLLQMFDLERTSKPRSKGDVVGGIIRRELAEVPEPFLSDREDPRFAWLPALNHRIDTGRHLRSRVHFAYCIVVMKESGTRNLVSRHHYY